MAKAIIIGKARDFDGSEYEIRESRTTRHGFEIFFGWPTGCRGIGYAGPQLIATPELVKYFEQCRFRRDGAIYDLPVSRGPIKRVRNLLGFNYFLENAEWWYERLEDLANMPGVQFARVHGVHESEVSVVRSKLIGKRLREPNWYRDDEDAKALLVGTMPRLYVAEKLDISIGAVGRLRWLVRKDSHA